MAEEQLKNIFSLPLSTKEAVTTRQNILKGFLGNIELLWTYNYSKSEFMEVHNFITNHVDLQRNDRFLSLFSKETGLRHINDYVQFVLFFNTLENKWIKELNKGSFPESYKQKLEEAENFLAEFEFQYYAGLIIAQKFSKKHAHVLSNKIKEKKYLKEWQCFWQHFFLFEAYISISIGIEKNKFSFPTLANTVLSIENFFHPLVKNPVKNSICIDQNLMLLTGPNMSGKSTLLRALGLCIFLTHCGLAIPASSAQIPFFDDIYIYINHNDNLRSGYSHFMCEIQNLKSIVRRASEGKKCFAIFDELFKGTNNEDALEITNLTLAGLRNLRTSFFIISTHLHELKDSSLIKEKEIDTRYIECVIEKGTPKFTYRLNKGWSSLKIGQIIFRTEGLSDLLNNN